MPALCKAASRKNSTKARQRMLRRRRRQWRRTDPKLRAMSWRQSRKRASSAGYGMSTRRMLSSAWRRGSVPCRYAASVRCTMWCAACGPSSACAVDALVVGTPAAPSSAARWRRKALAAAKLCGSAAASCAALLSRSCSACDHVQVLSTMACLAAPSYKCRHEKRSEHVSCTATGESMAPAWRPCIARLHNSMAGQYRACS